MDTKEWFLDETGALVQYEDAYKLSEEQVEDGQALGETIISMFDSIDTSYVQLGMALATFEKTEGYKAWGVPTFNVWLEDPQVGISYQQARYLIRIVTELIPRLPEGVERPRLSVMRELLPFLNDGADDAELAEALASVEGLTVRDAQRTLRERRGKKVTSNAVTFEFKVQNRGENATRLKVTRRGEDGDIYECGILSIKTGDMAAFEASLGKFAYIKE